jgi:rhodanese-related sulfurtransferase
MMADKILVDDGFKNARRYAGGLPDWEDAGYQLEGEMVDDSC